MENVDLSQFSVRTDLIVELIDGLDAAEQLTDNTIKPQVSGIDVKTKQELGMTVTDVRVNEEGSTKVGKKPGRYVTIETQSIQTHDNDQQINTMKVIASELVNMLKEQNINENSSGLIVGLGNNHVTPDALGPQVVNRVIVTQHIFNMHPENIEEGYRPVSAIAPGVTGTTGIETSDLVKAIVEKVKPDFLIVVDALAAKSIERVNKTVQISDTGIAPGSGVGNKRKEISKETIGVPVIAVGVPTVVDAVTITSDVIDYTLKYFGRQMKEVNKPRNMLTPGGFAFGEKVKYTDEDLPTQEVRERLLGYIGNLGENEKRQLIFEVLQPMGQNFIVTPKEIDTDISDLSKIISMAIDKALHKNVS